MPKGSPNISNRGGSGNYGGGRVGGVPAKRRIGSVGKAKSSVKKQADKDITRERKEFGAYPKNPYGRKSVNPSQRPAPVKKKK